MISYPLRIGSTDTRVIEAGASGAAGAAGASGAAGETIVLVHGTGGRADRWLRNVDALAAAGYRVVAFDLPGHGVASQGAGLDCSVPGYRRFLGDFLDALKIDKATIFGTSLGG